MNLQNLSPLVATTVVACIAHPAFAQFQASHPTAREVSVQAQPMTYTGPNPGSGTGAINFTVQGPATWTYNTFLVAPTPLDQAWQLGGATSGPSPFCFDPYSPSNILLTAPNSSGTFPAAGPVAFTVPASSTMIGQRLRWQVVAQDPGNPNDLGLSNCGDKDLFDVVDTTTLTTDPFATPIDGNALANLNLDVERGDIDGDGDIDTVLLDAQGRLHAVLSTATGTQVRNNVFAIGAIGGPPDYVPNAAAFELADVNNDNWLDLVVSKTIDGAGLMVQVHLNAGCLQFATYPGPYVSPTLGSWNGFSRYPLTITPQLDPILNIYPSSLHEGIDIETSDFDLDGDLDLVIAVVDLQPGGAALGAPNRIYTNTIDDPTVPADFVETTLPNPAVPMARSLFTAATVVYDDSEDVETGIFDDNAFRDVVFANVVGPAPVGAERVYLNTALPLMTGRFIVTPPANDETLDVAVGDINGDGADDIYAGNWLTYDNGIFRLPPVPDKLYLTSGGVPGSWTDMSFMLPDNQEPPEPDSEPRATSDVEIATVFSDTSPGAEVIIGYGLKGATSPPSGPLTTGVRLYDITDTMNYVTPTAWLGMNGLRDVDVYDMEMGDADRRFFDLDTFLAIQPGQVLFPTNYVIAARR